MNAPLIIFSCQLFLTLAISSQKQFEPTPSENHNFASAVTYPLLLFLIITSCAFYCCMHMYSVLLARSFKSPVFPVHCVFFAIFLINIIFVIYDFEVSREMQAGASLGHLMAYIFGIKRLYPSKVIDNGVETRSRAVQVLIDTIQRSGVHWMLYIFFILGTIGIFVLLSTYSRKSWASAFKRLGNGQKMQADVFEQYTPSPQFGTKNVTSVSSQKQDNQSQKIMYFMVKQKALYALFSLLAIIDVILFTLVALNCSATLAEAAPGNWNMLLSASSYSMSEDKLQKQIGIQRGQIQLPDDVRYLDNRSPVLYPFVVGDEQTYCRFNKCPKTAVGSVLAAQERPPNVVLIIIESFSPNPIFLTDPYNYQPFSEGQPFNASKIPNIARLASHGQTYQTVSSLGLPTVFGWHSLLTGHQPLSRGVNMAQEQRNSVYDLAAFFRDQNYTTAYVSPSPPDFDGKHNYLYRDTSFEYVDYGFPATGYDLPEPNSWVSDRLSEEAFERRLSTLYGGEKPFFATWMTVEMHTPFVGFDRRHFYNYSIADDYERVTAYTDKYVGKLLDFLERQSDQNTLVVAIGDHGARERPKPSKTPGIDSKCTGKVFGDAYFLTSGIMSYYGSNEAVKRLIPANTSVIGSTDANSFVFGLQNTIKTVTHHLLTNRLESRVSNAHRVLEYRSGGRILRSFTYSSRNAQTLNALPSCLAKRATAATGALEEARTYIRTRNSLQQQNRMWNDAFACRDAECELPALQEAKFATNWQVLLWILIACAAVGAACGWAAVLAVWWCRFRVRKSA